MPKKRGNNEGSIRQRNDGTWEGRYVSGYKADGKANRKSVFGKTQKEVQVKIRETLRQLDRRVYIEPSKITVEQWLDTWYGLYVANNLKPSTAVSYRNICDYYLKSRIGSLKLQSLRQENVQALVNELNQSKLKPATVKKVYMVLKTALQRAVRNQMLNSNPALYTILPKLNQEEIQFLTRYEQQELLDTLPDSANGRALRFILGTGLRASELVGLRWSDIHGDCLTVSQTIQRRGDLEKGKGTCIYFGTPKSKAGHRTVPLTAKMEDLLLYISVCKVQDGCKPARHGKTTI